MKNTILITVLVGAAAGASSSVLTRALTATAETSTNATESSDALRPGDTSDSEGLGEQLAALQRENDELAMRLAAVERAASGSAREAVGAGSPEDVEKMQQDIAALAAALKDPQSAQSAGFRDTVRTAMEQVREEQDTERAAERENRTIERIDERLTELQTKLGLDQVQMSSMRETLLTESSKRTEMFNDMRNGGGDRTSIRESMTTLREETQASLANILSPAQLEDYNESDTGGFGRGGRGGGGDTGGGNTGGGRRGGN